MIHKYGAWTAGAAMIDARRLPSRAGNCGLRSLVAMVSFVLALFLSSLPAEARRVVLVIGNATYAHASTLGSPHMDADEIEAVFKRMQFDVVVRLKDLGAKPDGRCAVSLSTRGDRRRHGGDLLLGPWHRDRRYQLSDPHRC